MIDIDYCNIVSNNNVILSLSDNNYIIYKDSFEHQKRSV